MCFHLSSVNQKYFHCAKHIIAKVSNDANTKAKSSIVIIIDIHFAISNYLNLADIKIKSRTN